VDAEGKNAAGGPRLQEPTVERTPLVSSRGMSTFVLKSVPGFSTSRASAPAPKLRPGIYEPFVSRRWGGGMSREGTKKNPEYGIQRRRRIWRVFRAARALSARDNNGHGSCAINFRRNFGTVKR